MTPPGVTLLNNGFQFRSDTLREIRVTDSKTRLIHENSGRKRTQHALLTTIMYSGSKDTISRYEVLAKARDGPIGNSASPGLKWPGSRLANTSP
jgi:hypothetical protein